MGAVDASRTIPGDLDALGEVRSWAVDLATAAGLGARQLGELELALTEAVSNVIRHAYADNAIMPVELRLTVDEAELQVLICDRGEFWSGEGATGVHEDGGGGYGIDLIGEIMDRVERRPREGGGTELLLVMERRD